MKASVAEAVEELGRWGGGGLVKNSWRYLLPVNIVTLRRALIRIALRGAITIVDGGGEQ